LIALIGRSVSGLRGMARWRAALVMCGSFAAPGALLLAWVAWRGGWLDFWYSYVGTALDYSGDRSLADMAFAAFRVVGFGQFTPLFIGSTVLFVLLKFVSRGRWQPRNEDVRWNATLCILWLVGALFACARPQFQLLHHHFLLLPVLVYASIVVLALLAGVTESLAGQSKSSWVARWSTPLAVLLICGPVFLRWLTDLPVALLWSERRHQLSQKLPATVPRLVSSLLQRSDPQAHTLYIWGWMPDLYFVSDLTCVCRYGTSQFIIDPTRAREFQRERLLEDLHRHPPDLLVDSIADGCFMYTTWSAPDRLESFPELAKFVADRYDLLGEADLVRSAKLPLRIWRLKTAAPSAPSSN
jgi:hypothetical protein